MSTGGIIGSGVSGSSSVISQYNTINQIKLEIEALYKNLSGKFPMTAMECDIVYGAITDAFQWVFMEYGLPRFKFKEEAITRDTTASQAYVDLPSYSLRIINGTVRIAAEDTLLSLIDEEMISQIDPNADETGRPTSYAYIPSGDPNVVRMGLWPTPDATYTIAMSVLQLPADDIQSFPIVLNAPIKLKAKELALLSLGLGNRTQEFAAAYERTITAIKETVSENVPKHVGIRVTEDRGYSMEGRLHS